MFDLGWWGSADEETVTTENGKADTQHVGQGASGLEVWGKLQAGMEESDRKLTQLVTAHEEKVTANIRGVEELKARLIGVTAPSRGSAAIASLRIVDDLKLIMESMQRDLAAQKQVLRLAVDEQLPWIRRQLDEVRAEIQELRVLRVSGPAPPTPSIRMPDVPIAPPRPTPSRAGKGGAGKGGRWHEFSLDIPKSMTGLGLKIDADDGQVLRIEELYDGAMGRWNKSNPKMALGPGDSIIEANGQKGDVNRMLEECTTLWEKDLFLKVRRLWWPGRPGCSPNGAEGDVQAAKEIMPVAGENISCTLVAKSVLEKAVAKAAVTGLKEQVICSKLSPTGVPIVCL